jgi:hypothetical protein
MRFSWVKKFIRVKITLFSRKDSWMFLLMKTRTKIHTNLTKTTILLKFIFHMILYPFFVSSEGGSEFKIEKRTNKSI